MPSFYGFLTFGSTYIIFLLDIIDFKPMSLVTHLLIWVTIFSFSLATLVSFLLNKKLLKSYKLGITIPNKSVLFFLYLIGFIGIFLYLREYFEFYGGALNYFLILFSNNSSELRANGQIAAESIGIQLSYLGWIGIAISFFHLRHKSLSRLWLIPLLLTFASNLLFIDRTRPMWILLVLLYIAFCINHYRLKLSILIKRSVLIVVIFLLIFLAIGNLAGKTTEVKNYKGWDVSPNVENIVFYLTSSYMYLDYIVCNEEPNYRLDRTINPLLKVLYYLKFTNEEPSSLINEFYGRPYSSNVGTFLEPYYRDFGLVYCLFAIFFHSFILNYLALFFLKVRTPYSLFLVSNICLVDFFSFFTPKLNNFPIWFFFGLGLFLFFKKTLFKNA